MDVSVCTVSVTNSARIAERSALGTYVSRFSLSKMGWSRVCSNTEYNLHSVLLPLTIRQWLFGNITPCAFLAHYIFFAFLWSRAAMIS